MSIMRVDSQDLPLSAIPLCQLLPCHLGPPRHMLSINLYVKGYLDCAIGASTCPYQQSLLSFKMRSRSSMSSRARSSLDLVVTMSCGLTLPISLIIALSFCCRCWRFGFVIGLEHCALHTRAVHAATAKKKTLTDFSLSPDYHTMER